MSVENEQMHENQVSVLKLFIETTLKKKDWEKSM